MGNKIRVIFIIGIPLLFLGIWVYVLFNYLDNKKDNSADINSGISNLELTGESSINKTDIQNNNNNIINGDNQINSGTTNISGYNNSGNTDLDTKIKKVNILMPDFFYNKGFEIIISKLLKEKKIVYKIQTLKDINEYKENLLSGISSGYIDIYMIPTDRIQSFENNGYKLDFKTDISQFFHYIFYDLLKHSKYTYIPYSIDPYITIVSNKVNIGNSLSIDKLNEIALIGGGSNKILFNISSFDVNLIKTGKYIFSDFFLILYNLIYQSYLSQNDDMLNKFIDYNNKSIGYNSKNIIKFINILKNKNKNCEYFVNVCILANGFGNISFGFSSYFDIWEKYFNGAKYDVEDFQVYNFLSESNVYLVRGWGFFINKNSTNINESLLFINEYLTQGVNGNSILWNNTFSSFKNILSNQRINKRYENIFQFEYKFQLLNLPIDAEKTFFKINNLIEMLKGNYSINAFLENIEWDF